jgi:hypothetical protein
MKYSKQLLLDILEKGDATVLEEYPTYTQRLHVKFRCKCGEETTKRFEMLNKYGYPYCEKCSLRIKAEKYKETCLERYGVTNSGKLPEVIEKINNGFIAKYGDHPKRTAEVQEKWKETCLLIYGGHPNQNIEVQAKSEASSYKYKDYILPSGNVIKLQGYENLALDELVQLYEENDIVTGKRGVPTIEYTINDTRHRYFPDIFIKSENKIIEVKSEWTIQLTTGNVEEKAAATIHAGYKYEIWVYNEKKVKTRTIRY